MRKIISKERGEKIRRGVKTPVHTCKHAGTRGLKGGSMWEMYKGTKYLACTFNQKL